MELEIAEPHRVQVGLFCVGADHALEYKMSSIVKAVFRTIPKSYWPQSE